MQTRRDFIKTTGASAASMALLGATSMIGQATPELRPAPNKAQAAWLGLGYGLFLHFGPNVMAGSEAGKGTFPAKGFSPSNLDCGQWAEVAKEAGMRYAVLTAKHGDGFCLWPSKYTDYCAKNSPAGDICGRFVEAFSKAGIPTGFYYSLSDRNCKFYQDDKAYAEYVRAQITELLTQYGQVTELFFDGAWEKDHPTGDWPFDPAWEKDPHSGLTDGERWEWKQLYELIHRLQSDCIVLNNSSSDRPGGVKYLPIDGRTAERFDFVFHEVLVEPIIDPIYHAPSEQTVYLPLEFCTTLTPDWFWTKSEYIFHPPVEAIVSWHSRAHAARANLLLNAGPDDRGLIPEYNRLYLRKAAKSGGVKC
jgi:alpha-L-fucosidase